MTPIKGIAFRPGDIRGKSDSYVRILVSIARVHTRGVRTLQAPDGLDWLIERIMLISRMQSPGRAEPLSEVFAELLETWRRIGDAHGHRVAGELYQPDQLTPDLAPTVALLAQEAVFNAFEHAFCDGRNGTVSLAIHPRADGTVLMTIIDDGTGLPEPDRFDRGAGAGRGRQLMRELVDERGGRIEWRARMSCGTLVVIELGGRPC